MIVLFFSYCISSQHKNKKWLQLQVIIWTDRHPDIISPFAINCKLQDVMRVLHNAREESDNVDEYILPTITHKYLYINLYMSTISALKFVLLLIHQF